MAAPGRPRANVDEEAIISAHRAGISMSALAIDHGVSRQTIRRVIHESDDATVLMFPSSYAPIAPEGHVTSLELIQRSGITYRQLDHWTRTNRLRPSTAADPGSGNARFFPASEIAVAHLMKRLTGAGMLPDAAHDLTRSLVATGSALLAGIRIDLPEEP